MRGGDTAHTPRFCLARVGLRHDRTMRPYSRPLAALGQILVGDSAASRAAALYSTVTAGASFMPGLMPRGLKEQVALTGVASTLQHTLVMNAQARHRLAARLICAWTGHESPRAVRTVEAAVAAGTTMAGAVGYAALRQRGGESFRRRAARTVAIRSFRIGSATLIVTAAEFVDERYGRRYPVIRVVMPMAGLPRRDRHRQRPGAALPRPRTRSSSSALRCLRIPSRESGYARSGSRRRSAPPRCRPRSRSGSVSPWCSTSPVTSSSRSPGSLRG